MSSGSKKSKEDDPSSKSTKNSGHFPMSERQQFALLKQMETQANKDDSRSFSPSSAKGSPRNCHIGLSSNSSTSSSCSVSSNRSTLTKCSDDKRIRDLEKKIFKKNFSGETLLIKMAKKGDFNTIKTLIKDGANINEQDFAGWTALHECSIRNYSHIVIYLLKHKANPNLIGGKGDTPLHDAARLGHVKVVKYLLRFGANPKIINENGQSPLDVATSKEVLGIFNKFLNRDLNQKVDDATSENISEDASLTDFDQNLDSKTPSTSSKSESVKALKKDPYAFDDDELDANEDIKNSLTIGIATGQPTKFDLSPIGPPLRLRFAKESGFYHLKDQENSIENGLKNSPCSVDSNDETGNKMKSDSTLTCPLKELKFSGTSKEEEDLQRVPPLIIKLGSPEPESDSNPRSVKKDSSSGDENDPDRPRKKSNPEKDRPGNISGQVNDITPTTNLNLTDQLISNSNPATPSQGSLPMSSSSSLSGGNTSLQSLPRVQTNQSSTQQQQQQQQQNSNQFSRSSTNTNNQLSSVGLSRRESRSGRTLRSHTAALRERERKDYTKSFYSNSGPPKKRRLQNSKSDSLQAQTMNSNSQDSISATRSYSDDNNRNEDKDHSNGPFNVNDQQLSGDEVLTLGDELDLNQACNDQLDPMNQVSYTQNPYENDLILHKEKLNIISTLTTVNPKLPSDFDQYLVQNNSYILANKLPPSITKRCIPANITDPVFIELFNQQENERYIQELKHLSERENLRISAEQAILRFYNRQQRSNNNNNNNISVSSVNSQAILSRLSFCNVIRILEITNVPNIFENLKQSHDSIRQYHINRRREEEHRDNNLPSLSTTSTFQDLIDHYQIEKKKMLSRQLHESDALMMVQKLDWELKNKELLNINTPFDHMTLFEDIPLQNVPPIIVPEDFALFPRDIIPTR